jgi:hypothetical protein
MRRLEFTNRRVRAVPGRARNAAEAMMYLANAARERHRIDQEKKALLKRLHALDSRLTALAGEETKLNQLARPADADAPASPPPPAPPVPPAYTRAAVPSGFRAVTLQY